MPPKKAPAKKLHELSTLVRSGFKIHDITKKTYIVGKQFATGGFGRIHICTEEGKSHEMVMKIEPSTNGPLLTEVVVFNRILKKEHIEAYKKAKKINWIGLPYIIANGYFTYETEKMRYMVIPKYATSLEAVREANGGSLATKDAFTVANCILKALEYLHDVDYTHADVKAANILLEKPGDFSTSVLVDFGLAHRTTNNVDKPDKKRAHNGTCIYTSTDAHVGNNPSFRGDVEILAYNMIMWLTGTLPWMSLEASPDKVFEAKQAFVSGIPSTLQKALKSASSPPVVQCITNMFNVSRKTGYTSKVDIDSLCKSVSDVVKKAPKEAKTPAKNSKKEEEGASTSKGRKARKVVVSDDDDGEEEEEEEKVVPKSVKAKSKKDPGPSTAKKSKPSPKEDSYDDDEEEEKEVMPKKKDRKTGTPARKQYDDEDEEEEEVLPKKKDRKAASKNSKNHRRDDDDEEDDEEEVLPKKKDRKTDKPKSLSKNHRHQEDDDDDEEEEVLPKKKDRKAGVSSSRKHRHDEDDEDDHDDDEVVIPKTSSSSSRRNLFGGRKPTDSASPKSPTRSRLRLGLTSSTASQDFTASRIEKKYKRLQTNKSSMVPVSVTVSSPESSSSSAYATPVASGTKRLPGGTETVTLKTPALLPQGAKQAKKYKSGISSATKASPTELRRVPGVRNFPKGRRSMIIKETSTKYKAKRDARPTFDDSSCSSEV